MLVKMRHKGNKREDKISSLYLI